MQSLSLRSPQPTPNTVLALFSLRLPPHYKEKVPLWVPSEAEEPQGLGGAQTTRSAVLILVDRRVLKERTPRSSRPKG